LFLPQSAPVGTLPQLQEAVSASGVVGGLEMSSLWDAFFLDGEMSRENQGTETTRFGMN
jgi:hypothetical protein